RDRAHDGVYADAPRRALALDRARGGKALASTRSPLSRRPDRVSVFFKHAHLPAVYPSADYSHTENLRMRRLVVALPLLLLTASASAQHQPNAHAQAMKRLGFLV